LIEKCELFDRKMRQTKVSLRQGAKILSDFRGGIRQVKNQLKMKNNIPI